MKLAAIPLGELLERFRDSNPTPGGGSASALAGAVGASLLAMVAALPRPGTTREDEARYLAESGRRCAALSDDLAALIDRDADAYGTVMAAYRLPKAGDDQKAVRSLRIQEALAAATEAPLDVMRCCGAAVERSATIAAFGNANAASDVQVGLELLLAALRGAALNVASNLGGMKDANYVAQVRGEAARLMTDAESNAAAARRKLTGAA